MTQKIFGIGIGATGIVGTLIVAGILLKATDKNNTTESKLKVGKITVLQYAFNLNKEFEIEFKRIAEMIKKELE